MPVINILSPHVADMIAAGEVVERPGSVVKELVENAVDAGAHNITVELRGGGATYIRVTDDGCGMAPEDAGNCFLRHATSKLKDEFGLEAIGTMGFRGEALAAISAVSRVELITRRPEDREGTRVVVAGGDIQEVGPAGCPQGTTFTVRDLFYNTPARLKFMKSDKAEGAYCVQLALRVALGRPDISIRCLRDGKEEFFTPGDGKASSAVYALLGREAALSMLTMENENEGVRAEGFVSRPAAGRGSRAMQYFFVNGRAIRSAILQAAVEQAYKNTLLVGRFPACVVYITLPLGAVDVNVHPTKNEVKFSSEKKVFDAVYYGTMNALRGENEPLRMELSQGTRKKLEPTTPPREEAPTPEKRELPGSAVLPRSAEPPRTEVHSPAAIYRTSRMTAPRTGAVPPPLVRRESAIPAPAPEKRELPAPEQTTLFPAEEAEKSAGVRVVGEVMRTYIIAERGETMFLIDKHAAHERMNFDRLKAEGRRIMSQTLMTPEPWRPRREDYEILEENRELMEELGFQLDALGEDILVRGVPDALDPAQTVPALEEIAEKLRRGRRDLSRDEILQTISCKAAIKAGWDTDPRELQVLAEKVASGEIRYCPHGRPVAVTLTRKDLDKQFKRIV